MSEQATQNDHSAAAEKAHFCRNSGGKRLLSLSVVNVHADTDYYLHLFDTPVAALAGTSDFTVALAANYLMMVEIATTWRPITKVAFSTTDTLPAPLVATRDYYIRWTNQNADVFLTLADAMYCRNQVTLTDEGTGTHTATVAYAVTSAPLVIGAGLWERLVFPGGRQFQDGIYAALSTVATGLTLPGTNIGYFEAEYTT